MTCENGMCYAESLGQACDHWEQECVTARAEREYWVAEAQQLREAIADALADLTPGYAPHFLLSSVLEGQGQVKVPGPLPQSIFYTEKRGATPAPAPEKRRSLPRRIWGWLST